MPRCAHDESTRMKGIRAQREIDKGLKHTHNSLSYWPSLFSGLSCTCFFASNPKIIQNMSEAEAAVETAPGMYSRVLACLSQVQSCVGLSAPH